MTVEIIEFEEGYIEDLRKLTYEWIEKYFYIEPEDEAFLNHPGEKVLGSGGHIFLAKYGDQVIGTVALFKISQDTFELAKLAVTEKYQGLKVGKKLMDHCLKVARQEGVQRIILDTNRKLVAAVALYRKFGFKEVPIGANKYIEVDLKMELAL